jgi:uncharacterized protein YbcI
MVEILGKKEWQIWISLARNMVRVSLSGGISEETHILSIK